MFSRVLVRTKGRPYNRVSNVQWLLLKVEVKGFYFICCFSLLTALGIILGHLFLWDLWGHGSWPPDPRVPQPRKDSLGRLDDAPCHGRERQCRSWLTSIFTMSHALVRLTKNGKRYPRPSKSLSRGFKSAYGPTAYVLKLFPCPGVKEFPTLLLLEKKKQWGGEREYFLLTNS